MGAHYFIRKILKPVKQLTEGVQQIGEGNFDYQVNIKRKDEFGKLGKAFNQMANKIREMISSRDRLLLDVSHVLRSPITRIKLALEFFQMEKRKRASRTIY